MFIEITNRKYGKKWWINTNLISYLDSEPDQYGRYHFVLVNAGSEHEIDETDYRKICKALGIHN